MNPITLHDGLSAGETLYATAAVDRSSCLVAMLRPKKKMRVMMLKPDDMRKLRDWLTEVLDEELSKLQKEGEK